MILNENDVNIDELMFKLDMKNVLQATKHGDVRMVYEQGIQSY